MIICDFMGRRVTQRVSPFSYSYLTILEQVTSVIYSHLVKCDIVSYLVDCKRFIFPFIFQVINQLDFETARGYFSKSIIVNNLLKNNILYMRARFNVRAYMLNILNFFFMIIIITIFVAMKFNEFILKILFGLCVFTLILLLLVLIFKFILPLIGIDIFYYFSI